MSTKVKRGLGLLAVAALAAVIAWGTSYDSAATGVGMTVAWVAWLTCLGAGVVGLALIAWGLLRD